MASFNPTPAEKTEITDIYDQHTGAIMLKYPETILDEDLVFLRRLVQLSVNISVTRETPDERLQDLITFFQFIIDDISGPEQRFYRLCDTKAFVHNELGNWVYIGDEIGYIMIQRPIILLNEYQACTVNYGDERLQTLQRIMHELIVVHDVRIYSIQPNDDGEYDSADPEQQPDYITGTQYIEASFISDPLDNFEEDDDEEDAVWDEEDIDMEIDWVEVSAAAGVSAWVRSGQRSGLRSGPWCGQRREIDEQ